MAKEKKFVESITDMELDFPQWYTDVVKKADLTEYSSLKGCMIIVIWLRNLETIRSSWTDAQQRVMKTYTCPCSSPKACCRKKKTM